MNQKMGSIIFIGWIIGAIIGYSLGRANGNPVFGILTGSSGGVFLGWFIVAAITENQKTK